MQILYTENGKTHDIGTRAGKEAAFGKAQGTPIVMTDESGEIICAYNNVADIPRNTALIKSIRERYPHVSLRKALDLFENELMLKSKLEKNEILMKARPVSKPVTKIRPGWEKFDRLLTKLDEILMAQSAR